MTNSFKEYNTSIHDIETTQTKIKDVVIEAEKSQQEKDKK